MAKQSKTKEEKTDAPVTPKPSPTSLIALLAQRFVTGAEQVIATFPYEHRMDLIQHFSSIVGYMERFSKADNEEEQNLIFSEYADKEHLLLEKYGELLKEYDAQKFNQYFDVDHAIMDFEVVPLETYYEILQQTGEEQLGTKGMNAFLQLAGRTIARLKRDHLLNKEPKASVSDQVGGAGGTNEQAKQGRTNKEATKARALLALYFMLLVKKIKGRETHHVSDVSEFAHMLMGVEYTPNDDIYKMLLKMPNYKTDKLLLEDLKYIRPRFDKLDMAEELKLIDEEIARTSKERKSGRKDY